MELHGNPHVIGYCMIILPEINTEVDGMAPWITIFLYKQAAFHFHDDFRACIYVWLFLLICCVDGNLTIRLTAGEMLIYIYIA